MQEVFTIFLDAGINGGDFSTLNKIGMVVCLTGVALHVFRKVKMGDSSDGGGGGSKVNISLLKKIRYVCIIQ